MKRASTVQVLVVLLAIVAVLGGVCLAKGGFYLGKHEGDTLHLAELVLRMAGGQWPHLDIMTPIGVLALAPVVLFVKLGWGLGHAIFYAQILVALLLLPAVLRVTQSRMAGYWRYAYGAFVMVMCLALVHGEAESSVSISMHYNRWAWAVSYIVVPLAVLSPAARRPWLDGGLVGLGMAILVLMKVTYFVALAPGVAIALLARREWASLAAAVLAGLAVAAIVTAMAGPEFWLAYLRDLATVAGGDIRAQPGESFVYTVAAPMFMGASFTLIAAVILLRQAGRSVEGMALLFLMPGFFYIAYQNYGNDPQWLFLLGFLAFLLRPAPGTLSGQGWDLRDALRIVGLLAFAFGTPSAVNLIYSPFRHLATPTDEMVPLLPRLAAHRDIFSTRDRLYRVNIIASEDGVGTPFATYRAVADRPAKATLNGEELRECQLNDGYNAWFETVTTDLEGAGYGGKAIMGADLFSLYWAFGNFRTVKGAAPWYYGGLAGAENADYVVIPVCPMQAEVRLGMLKSFADEGWTLTEVRRTPLYILVQAKKPASAP